MSGYPSILVNALQFPFIVNYSILFYSIYQVKASSAKNCQDFCNIYGDCSTFVFSSQISTAENCDLVSMVSLACTVGLDEIYSRVVRASDSQCRSRNCPGFYPASFDTVESEGRQMKQC